MKSSASEPGLNESILYLVFNDLIILTNHYKGCKSAKLKNSKNK